MSAEHTQSAELDRISLAVTPALRRVLDALTHNRRLFNRSLIVREAIIEKADRELHAGWRAEFGIQEDGEAA